MSEERENYVVSSDALELVEAQDEQGDTKETPVCTRCGGPHRSPFECPLISDRQKRQCRKKGGTMASKAGTRLAGDLLTKRAGRKKVLTSLLADASKLPNTPSRASIILNILASWRREFEEELTDEAVRLFQEAERVLKEKKLEGDRGR
jgi:hypothetical protein